MATPSSDDIDRPWVDPVAIDIDNVLAEDQAKFERTRRLNPSVFRVPTYVRKLKPDVYETSFLPMGLLYDRKFKGMSSLYHLKLEVLGCFLELLKVDKDRWMTFCKEVATQPPDSAAPYLQNFYENDGTYSFPTLESMESHLVTDAFFIVGLFIWNQKPKLIKKQNSRSNEQPRFIRRLKQIFYRGSLGSSVHALDLDICWLYEGQIPLFLLKNAWKKIASASRSVVEIGSFTTAVKDNLFRTLMYSGLAFDVRGCTGSDFKFCDHLLACVHKAITGGEGEEDDEDEEEEKGEDEKDEGVLNGKDEWDKESTEEAREEGDEDEEQSSNSDDDEHEEAGKRQEDEGIVDGEHTGEQEKEKRRFKGLKSVKSYIYPIGRPILEFVTSSVAKLQLKYKSDHYSRLTLPSATQLATAGIRFQCHDGLTYRVEFKKSFFRLSATLYLARIYVADFTETMLLNMCVYESMNRQDEGVHNYVMLMDELIDTEEDVELLMDGKNPIMTENRLGDNKQVVGIFTNPVQNLYFVKGNTYGNHAIVRDEMIAWYNNPWRRRIVQFLDSYRVAPWLLLSLLAAISLLILTFLQTIYTIWGFYKS